MTFNRFLLLGIFIGTELFLPQKIIAQTISEKENNVLELYLSPSRKYLNWSTPRSLISSYMDSRINSNILNLSKSNATSLGHSIIHIDCTDSKDIHHDIWTGTSGNDNMSETKTLMFKEKIGVDVLFYGFTDGYIQDVDEAKLTLVAYKGRQEKDTSNKSRKIAPRFLQFVITPAQCDQALDFNNTFSTRQLSQPTIEEVKNKKPNEILYYGLSLDPYSLYLQSKIDPDGKLGGGCTSFMAGFLKATNLYTQIFNTSFIRTLLLDQDKLIGNKDNPVSLPKILFSSRGKSWTYDDTVKIKNISFFDPEYIWQFFDSTLNCTNPDTHTFIKCNDLSKEWISDLKRNGKNISFISKKIISNYKNLIISNMLYGTRIE